MTQAPGYPPRSPWDPRMLGPDICPQLPPARTVHRNPWFEVKDRGGYFTTENLQSHGAVMPVVDERAVVLVRARRPVIDDETLELPAGGFSLEQESPEQGMRRELAEETGILIPDLTRFQALPPIAVSPNRDPRLIFPLRVDISTAEFAARGEHDEEISEVLCLPLERIAEMILDGEIYVALPVAMLSRLLLEARRGDSRKPIGAAMP